MSFTLIAKKFISKAIDLTVPASKNKWVIDLVTELEAAVDLANAIADTANSGGFATSLAGLALLAGGNTWSGNQNFGSGTLTTTGAVGTGPLTVGGRLVWGSGTYTTGLSQIYNDAVYGTVIVPKTGSSYDLVITNGSSASSILVASNSVISMPHYGAGVATFDANGNISSVSSSGHTVTQNDVTSSRALDTIYHNTTGYLMTVGASVNTAGGTQVLTGYSNASNSSTTVVSKASSSTGESVPSFFDVPVGYYYSILHTGAFTPTLTSWIEWY